MPLEYEEPASAANGNRIRATGDNGNGNVNADNGDIGSATGASRDDNGLSGSVDANPGGQRNDSDQVTDTKVEGSHSSIVNLPAIDSDVITNDTDNIKEVVDNGKNNVAVDKGMNNFSVFNGNDSRIELNGNNNNTVTNGSNNNTVINGNNNVTVINGSNKSTVVNGDNKVTVVP